MISFIFSLLSSKRIVYILLGLAVSSSVAMGYMLKKNIQKNAVLEDSVEQWKKANELSIQAYNELNKKLLWKEHYINQAKKELREANKRLAEIKDETNCLDTTIPNDLRMLLQETSNNK